MRQLQDKLMSTYQQSFWYVEEVSGVTLFYYFIVCVILLPASALIGPLDSRASSAVQLWDQERQQSGVAE
jgi:hypothetical protein